jgi:putative two-component system response regulator
VQYKENIMQVLVVDDDEVALEMLNALLEQAGYEVVSAANGQEALDILRDTRCRLVITDWEMPGINGLDLCHAIRSEPLSRYVYTILLTSHDTHEKAAEGLSAGADDYVFKPFHPDELLVRLRTGERILSLETREVAIFTMAKLAESRDPETGRHLERVQNYCRMLAEWFKLNGKGEYKVSTEFVEMVYHTSPLHDIGKVGIPDAILLKPGRLNDREFEVMKRHTTVGADALGAAVEQFPDADFLRIARDIAAAHHERFDGSGYPLGLVGQNIPLAARIVSLADVYDALTSKRVYKATYGHEISRAIIQEESGAQFDSEIVTAFLETEPEFVKIREQYSEETVEIG